MTTDNVLQLFLVESRELLEDMETKLLLVVASEERDEIVNAIFRAAHTIKGSAGLFGLDHIVSFTHAVESVLDEVRDGRIPIAQELVSVLLRCADHIGSQVDGIARGHLSANEASTQAGQLLLEELRAHLPSLVALEAPASAFSDRVTTTTWHLSLRLDRDAFRKGVDPLAVLRHLQTLGTIEGLFTMYAPSGLAETADPEDCALGFELALASEASEEAIEKSFDLVRDELSSLWILPPQSQVSAYLRLLELLPEGPARLRDAFVHCGSVSASQLDAALKSEAEEPSCVHLFDDLPPEPAEPARAPVAKPVPIAKVETSPAKGQPQRDHKPVEARSIRVDADRLDHLIDLVGELIIASAGAELIGRGAKMPELQEATSTVAGLVQELRENALQLRMVKIAATLNRFQRVVHDVARELGKDIVLTIDGEETELDKTVVEKIGDPLMHLVRNAMDHGIEPAEVRLSRGKPAQGTVRLNAFHDSGSIVIQVSDDGGGLKRDRILAKAIERGLVEPGRTLSEAEIYGLIFAPGFSTSEQVTNLSGRGVGMDVVKRNITALRGAVAVDSEEGVGTTVTIRLPLTLAIINGFLIGLGQSTFVIPLDSIEECVAFTTESGGSYTNLRGQVLPYVRLRELFDIEGPRAIRENIVVIRHGERRAGLVVDSLLGEFQTVIKPLGKMFGSARCLSGSTILGNGQVALILDVPALLEQAARAGPAQLPRALAVGRAG